MSILSVNPTTTGLVGISPAVIQIETDDTITEVQATGYLNNAKKIYGNVFSNLQMALVYTTDVGPTWLRVSISGLNTSLVAPSEPGTGDVSGPSSSASTAIARFNCFQ